MTELPTDTSYLRSLFVEGFGVHLRNLIDFFYPPPNVQEDDILAEDFCDPGKWVPGPMSPTLQQARERVNKEIGHITYKRKRPTDSTKVWNVPVLFGEIKKLEKEFVKLASGNKLHQKIFDLVNAPPTMVSVLLQNASTSSSNIVMK